MSTDPDQMQRDAGGDTPEERLDAGLPVVEPGATDSTVGTGSFFAIGCVVLALVVIFLGIAIFLFR